MVAVRSAAPSPSTVAGADGDEPVAVVDARDPQADPGAGDAAQPGGLDQAAQGGERRLGPDDAYVAQRALQGRQRLVLDVAAPRSLPDAGARLGLGRRVGLVLERQDAERLEVVAHPGRQQPEAAQVGHDLGEHQRPEPVGVGRLQQAGGGHGGVDAEVLPHRGGQEAVPEERARLDHEVLPHPKVDRVHIGVRALQRQDPEGHVAGLVPPHQLGEAGDERVGEQRPAQAERGQGDPLDEDLHAEVGEVDVRLVHHLAQQLGQRWAARVGDADLVEVPLVGLDVAGLVADLDRGVQLVVERVGGCADLGRRQQRTLLAVHELTDQPAVLLGHELPPQLGRGAERVRQRAAQPAPVDAARGVRRHLGAGVDLDRPVEVDRGVPLRRLGPLVEARHPGTVGVVVPHDARGHTHVDVLDRCPGPRHHAPRTKQARPFYDMSVSWSTLNLTLCRCAGT
jgi:hypothetical protein